MIVNPLSVHPRPLQAWTDMQEMIIKTSQKTHSIVLRTMVALRLYHLRSFSTFSVPIIYA
jgi:hypothetical protein